MLVLSLFISCRWHTGYPS